MTRPALSGAVLGRWRVVLPHTLLGLLLAVAGQVSTVAHRSTKTQAKTQAAPAARPNLRPKLTPGDVMRYEVEFRTTSDTKGGGAVQDPEGPSHIVIVWDATIRMEVLGGPGDTGGNPGVAEKEQDTVSGDTLRLRTTYEQSAATVQSDTPDPQAESIIKRYAQLQGRAIEFTMDAGGRVSAVRGLQQVLSDENTIQAAQQWISQLSAGASAPVAGAAPGMTWSSEQAADLPVAGLTWRSDSTYLRDEACDPAPPSGSAANALHDACAVILTNLTLAPARHAKGDATPDEFRRRGLETKGYWTGSGESLTYVSLRTGWVVSASQSSTQEMDVSIANALDTSVHYAGTVQTYSQISLLPPPAPSVR